MQKNKTIHIVSIHVFFMQELLIYIIRCFVIYAWASEIPSQCISLF
jgi:hypothetical protein